MVLPFILQGQMEVTALFLNSFFAFNNPLWPARHPLFLSVKGHLLSFAGFSII